jgi:CCR4-NOT transcription complex subunit 7/8
MTLSDDNGETPPGKCSWQFNLLFDINVENYAKDSIELLKTSGLNFEKHKTSGIPHRLFAEHFIISGLCCNANTHWITFHGGVDFAYLLKSLQVSDLP